MSFTGASYRLQKGDRKPATLPIEDRAISFSPARQDATLAYITEHYGKHPEDLTIEPRVIVLHWTAIDDFEGHPLWLELDASYRTDKVDPGDRFMTAVRNAVAGLNLKAPPG